MRGCRLPILIALAILVSSAATALAQPISVAVHDDLAVVFELLAAGYPGEPPVRAGDRPDLTLAAGSVDWRDTRSVAVLPDAVLTLESDRDEARAFQRYATSAAAQRLLVDAGYLPASVTVVDQTGRSVTVAQPVERVATPYALATYLVYGVGAGDRVALANYLGARDPEGAAAMTRIDPRFPQLGSVAPQETTNVEFIARIAPDVVFAAARSEWIPSVEALGIPVLALDGESTERLRGAVQLAGSLLGPDAAARADAWIRYYDHVLAEVAAASAGVGGEAGATRVLFTGSQRTTVASGAMYQSALIEAAGGASVTAALTGHWNEVGVEQVLVWDPDLILVPPYGGASVEAIVEDPEWRLLRAVREERVLRLPKLVAPWDTPVPDSVLAVVWLAQTLRPGAIDLDCADETRFFYRRFYGYAISDEEVATLCQR
jgi:iron complex transport system substrate-binding protein